MKQLPMLVAFLLSPLKSMYISPRK